MAKSKPKPKHRFDAKRKAAKKPAAARTKLRPGASKGTRKAVAPRTTPRRHKLATDQELPIEGGVKDPIISKHAKTYAEEMHESEEALLQAASAKQAIRTRMRAIGATMSSAHGYDFIRTAGEETFTARKQKRGSKPADTVAEPIAPAPPPPVDVNAEADHDDDDLDTAPFGTH